MTWGSPTATEMSPRPRNATDDLLVYETVDIYLMSLCLYRPQRQ